MSQSPLKKSFTGPPQLSLLLCALLIAKKFYTKLKLPIIYMTKYQLILPVDSQNVTKNQTCHRMHVEGPQLYQINFWTNSFQNMYGVLQATIDRLAGKIDLCKQTLQNRLFWVISMHSITLYVIDMHNIRCLKPFYHSLTTLKFSGFWKQTGSIS